MRSLYSVLMFIYKSSHGTSLRRIQESCPEMICCEQYCHLSDTKVTDTGIDVSVTNIKAHYRDNLLTTNRKMFAVFTSLWKIFRISQPGRIFSSLHFLLAHPKLQAKLSVSLLLLRALTQRKWPLSPEEIEDIKPRVHKVAWLKMLLILTSTY